MMVILKVGGAVLGSGPEGFQRLIEHMRAHQGGLLVVSALGSTTRRLAAAATAAQQQDEQGARSGIHEIVEGHREMAGRLKSVFRGDLPMWEDLLVTMDAAEVELHQLMRSIGITRQLSSRTLDRVLAYGERLALAMSAQVLRAHGVDVVALDAREWMVTSPAYGAAEPLMDKTRLRVERAVRPLLATHPWVLTQGFVGAAEDGSTTTMGRESSNLTATVAGAVLHADRVIIVTDVEGVRSADPHMVEGTELRPQLTYAQARIAAHHGVKVLYPTMIEPAEQAQIPIVLESAVAPGGPHTVIANHPSLTPVRPMLSVVMPNAALPHTVISLVFVTTRQWLWMLERLTSAHDQLEFAVHSDPESRVVEVHVTAPLPPSLVQDLHRLMLESVNR